jgi:hypothetical protein
MDWVDWGAKVGLKTTADVTNWLTVGLGGTVGFAVRDTSLAANDAVVDVIFPVTGVSSLYTSSSAVPLVANAATDMVIKPYATCAACEIRVFFGLDCDSRVPGILAPTILNTAFPEPSVPAGIKFSPETSYYVGGGLTAITFTPAAKPLASLR